MKQIVEEFLQDAPGPKEQDIMVKIIKMQELIATNQTGKTPVILSRGAMYMMVMVGFNGNAILVASMNNRMEGEIIKAYLLLLQCLRNARIHPKHQILNNEASEEY